MPPETLELVVKGGIVGVCVLVIWMGWKREERMAAEQEKRDIRTEDAFEKLNERNQQVHAKTIEQLSALNANTVALHEEIRQRPCVQDPHGWNGHERRTGEHHS